MTKPIRSAIQGQIDYTIAMRACDDAMEHFETLSAIAQLLAGELRNSDPKKAKACAKMIRKISKYNDHISYVWMNLSDTCFNKAYDDNIRDNREDVSEYMECLVKGRRKFNARKRRNAALIKKLAAVPAAA